MAAPYTNADGLQVKFPNYYTDPYNAVNKARTIVTQGATEIIELHVDLSKLATGVTSFTTDLNNDGTRDGFSDEDPRIPANSAVESVEWITQVAAVGGTSWTVGTYKIDGTTISANSLMTATESVTANAATIGFKIYGAGALTATTAGTAGVGTKNAYVGITPSGTFTAGQGLLIIKYTKCLPELQANNI